jgi:cytochrome o ubiquinol oxidase operon protein cyoD
MSTHTYFEKIGLLTHGKRSAWVSYTIGFLLSVLITLTAFSIVTHHVFAQKEIIISIILLACVQFFVQAIAFLHLGWGAVSRERTIVFIFVSMIAAILVSGSLWIMISLNERMMPSTAQM